MIYYLLLKGDKESESIFDSNVLGEESFGTFYPSVGFMILKRIVDQKPDIVTSIKILDEQNNSHTITSFLDKLEQWRIKKAWLV